ncbi:MAG: hypothetical protein ABSH22_17115, partial [Tepidisphaeraceae bacterium]
MKRLLPLATLATLAAAAILFTTLAPAQQSPSPQSSTTQLTAHGLNLAVVATPSAFFVSGDQSVNALNNGFDPRNSRTHPRGAYGNWPHTSRQWGEWIEYDWSKPISTNSVDLYFYNDNQGLRPPAEYRFSYWNGIAFVPVENAAGLGNAQNQYNTTTFNEVTTSRLRMEFNTFQTFSAGILQWKVYDSGKSPLFPPRVTAGVDRIVVGSAQTYLNGSYKVLGNVPATLAWTKASGPGDVTFADASKATTTATFSTTGEYTLRLATEVTSPNTSSTTSADDLTASDTLHVRVESPAPTGHLDPVYTTPYTIDSPLWNDRVKALIVNWIPHCVAELSDLNLREGGINNFIQAANKLNGRPA